MTRIIGIGFTLLALAWLVQGCVSAPHVVDLHKPIKLRKIVCMDATKIPSVCSGGVKDDGSPFEVLTYHSIDLYGRKQVDEVVVENPSACYDPIMLTIYLPFKDCPTDTFIHEICHAMGYKPKECDKYPWSKTRPS